MICVVKKYLDNVDRKGTWRCIPLFNHFVSFRWDGGMGRAASTGLRCSFDRAEIAEKKKIGLYLLLLSAQLKINVGLYRDERLAVCFLTSRQTEKHKERNVQSIPITWKALNHPGKILTNIPLSFTKKTWLHFLKWSSFLLIFITPYREAWIKMAFKINWHLTLLQTVTTGEKELEKVPWFILSFSANVKTNVDKKIPLTYWNFTPTNKSFTEILWGCCTSVRLILSQLISRHVSRLLNQNDQQTEKSESGCHCQGGTGSCPLAR